MVEKKRGRPKGSRNKLKYDLQGLMSGKLTDLAVKELEKILLHPDTSNADRLRAINLIFNRGHGKPQQTSVVGVEAGPNLKELMVRFMKPEETMKEIREANSKVIEHLDPDNTKRKAY